MNVAFSASKPPAGPVQQLKGKLGSSQGGSAYPLQRQSSRVRDTLLHPTTFFTSFF